jgi:hypothetical protein
VAAVAAAGAGVGLVEMTLLLVSKNL